MSKNAVGWMFVAAQGALIVGLVLLPGRDDWSTNHWVKLGGAGFIGLGFIVMISAALRLGTTLTPTPVPRDGGELQTGGLYQFVRHPIYAGVLAVVVGLTIRSGSFITTAVAIVTLGFFNAKAQWEEAQLAKTYPEYRSYARSTPRFVPRPWQTKD